MKWGRRILVAVVACVVVGIIVAAVWPGHREPVYRGKKLSEWLRAYELGYGNEAEEGTFIREREAASDAIRHLGTNALPWLVRWIEYEPPASRGRFRFLLRKLPFFIRERLWDGDRLAINAVWGFRILGTNGAPAVPELARIINESGRKDSRGKAMHALARIGKESFPPLLEVLETGHFGRSTASDCILQLHRSGVDVSRAVPALLIQDRETQKYSDSNPHLDLAYALPVLAEDPRFLVAALTNCLRHSNDDVRVEAARALGGLGAEAHPAVPSLVGALNDPVVLVRDAATNALGKIAPEVLEGIEQRQVQEGGGKSDVNPSP